MLRSLLLLSGFLFLAGHWLFPPISANGQFIIFLTGIIFLGIPHGAADLLVANKSAESGKQKFSALHFFVFYISRLVLFGVLIYIFPVAGIVLFLLFAAYHFGETDLHFFNTRSVIGKLLVCSYGLVILSVILLNNIDEVQLLIQRAGFSIDQFPFLNWVAQNHYLLLSFSLIFFFSNIFLYFIFHKNNGAITEYFLLQFAVLVFLLFNLPLLVGFTFYFIVWHSVLSLQNILGYLGAGDRYTHKKVVKQVVLYSALALVGIVIVGSLGFMFISTEAITIYIFLGLAVLTAPHMQIMHDMYGHIRTNYHTD